MVIEEIIKRNLQGEEIEYKIDLAGEDQVYLSSISDIQVIDNLEHARTLLINRITKIIDELVEEVDLASKSLFSHESDIHLINQDNLSLEKDANI